MTLSGDAVGRTAFHFSLLAKLAADAHRPRSLPLAQSIVVGPIVASTLDRAPRPVLVLWAVKSVGIAFTLAGSGGGLWRRLAVDHAAL